MAEAQTLTYDSNEQPEGELTTEEKESLEVGEKLAEQQTELLAGKFKDAEELEKGYIELQKKLGSPEEKTEEESTETKDEKVEEKDEKVDTAFLDTLWEEAQGEFSKETLDKLVDMKPQDVAQMYLNYRADQQAPELTDENVETLKSIPGGEEQYGQMMQWASDNLSEQEVKMYDAVMEKGDPLAAFFAVKALHYRFTDSQGVDGRMLTGKAVKSEKPGFKSQAALVAAMSDPKYDTDPAYRQEVMEKLARSDIDF